MAEAPKIHIDDDWKRQAQEEKRRLAEEEAKKAQQQPAAPAAGAEAGVPSGTAAGAGPAPRGRQRGQMPQPTFESLVQSMVTQILFYLGDLTTRGMEPQVNLDMAKYNIDLLAMLEEKTKNNLSEEERRLLDSALYETRMRFVSVAQQYATV